MYIPKRYGQSKVDQCPFCGRHATTSNPQGVPVCTSHKESKLEDIRCVCGEHLEVRTGKFGAYFSCINCGNVNMKKILELNDIQEKSEPAGCVKKERYPPRRPTETTVRSDDPRYF